MSVKQDPGGPTLPENQHPGLSFRGDACNFTAGPTATGIRRLRQKQGCIEAYLPPRAPGSPKGGAGGGKKVPGPSSAKYKLHTGYIKS